MSTHADHLAVLATLAEHLTTYDLPDEIASTAVHREITGHSVTVHLGCRVLPELAAALLAWADTFTGITAQAWRPPSGQTVHLSVAGHLADGSPTDVYGALSYTVQLFGPHLDPGERTRIPLGLLREWTELRGIREVA